MKCVGFVSTCYAMLGAALRCLMAIRNVGRAIEHFFCLTFSFEAKVSNSMLCVHRFYGTQRRSSRNSRNVGRNVVFV